MQKETACKRQDETMYIGIPVTDATNSKRLLSRGAEMSSVSNGLLGACGKLH